MNNLLEIDLKQLNEMHPHDIAAFVSTLNDEQRTLLYERIEPQVLALVLAYLDPYEAAADLSGFDIETQTELIDHMQPDDAADIILELDDDQKESLLETLDKDDDVFKLLTYDEKQAGAFMTNRFIKVLLTDTVKQATKTLIKYADEVENISYVLVVDEHNHFIGNIPLKSLIKATHNETLESLIKTAPSFLDTESIDVLIRHIRQYGSDMVAIVDSNQTLIGTITSDDLIDIYEDETLEDYEKLAALPDSNPEDHVFKKSVTRLPWLLALLILSIPIALITQAFEEVISTVVILAFFQPLILDAGGDVASQTLAVTLIGIKEDPKKNLKNGFKEVMSGIISGLFLAFIAFLITLGYAYLRSDNNPFELASVIAIGLLSTVILGPIIGFLVPITLNKFKFDPAIASGPLITTLVDMLSLVIYFGVALIFLGGSL